MNKRTSRRTDCATVVMKKADKGGHSAQSGQLELGRKCGKTIRFLRDHGGGVGGCRHPVTEDEETVPD